MEPIWHFITRLLAKLLYHDYQYNQLQGTLSFLSYSAWLTMCACVLEIFVVFPLLVVIVYSMNGFYVLGDLPEVTIKLIGCATIAWALVRFFT